MAESMQRILVRRALSGQYPQSPEHIIEWLEQTVAGWNEDPTPFVWHGKRQGRRQRARLHRLAGSGAAVLAYASSLQIDPLSESDRKSSQVQVAEWYQHYANHESHDLADYLEAYRLWRAAGKVERAAELAISLGEILDRFGLYELGRKLYEITISDTHEIQESLMMKVLHQLGNIAFSQGRFEEANRLCSENLIISERLGDRYIQALTLHQLGILAQQQGKVEEAHRLYSESDAQRAA